jgi:adenylate kinase
MLTREALDGGVVLDGFPRTVRQAAWLDSLLADFGLPTPTVLHLCVSGQELLRRLTARRYCAVCGATYNGESHCARDGSVLVARDDDSEEVVLRRLAEFDRMSTPLTEYYRGRDYHKIDGEKNTQTIANELRRIVQPQYLPARYPQTAALSTIG